MSKQQTYFQVQQQYQKLVINQGAEVPAVTELLLGITGWTPIELLRQQRNIMPTSQQEKLKKSNSKVFSWLASAVFIR